MTSHGDARLSETGERQLQFRLTTKAEDFKRLNPDLVFSSPLQRALRTAMTAYPHHNIVLEPQLREIGTDAGMLQDKLRALIPEEKTESVDLRRITKVWWGTETEEAAQQRTQRILEEIFKLTSKGKKVAIVAHSLLFRAMADDPKPFPKELWDIPRAWPRNFKPYYGKIVKGKRLFVEAKEAEQASVVLLRHAHPAAQEASTLLKKATRARQ